MSNSPSSPWAPSPSSPALHEVRFGGGFLRRGFWLYAWEITPAVGDVLYYVGRTGDSSSTNAQSPFNRMGQHLGFSRASNALRRHLDEQGVDPEACRFRLVAFGPVETESTTATRDEHDKRRDAVAAMENALAAVLSAVGCRVINTVNCRKPLDATRFAQVRSAFASAFPKLTPGGAAPDEPRA